jgi:DNA gyrase subunit B
LTDYNAEQIKVLKGLEPVRERPGMYIGSTDTRGLHHMIWEVVDNSIDEFLAGNGDKIKVSILNDNYISVEDWGRGIPVDTHKEHGRSALELVMTTLHAGGKFDNDSYKVSGGLHGVGISVVNALSSYLVVEIYRDGKKYIQEYKKGVPQGKLKKKKGYKTRTGTYIKYKADDNIFDNVKYSYKTIYEKLKQSAYLNKGLKIILEDKTDNKKDDVELCFEGGIKAFVKDLNSKKKVINKDVAYIEKNIKNYNVEIAFQHNKGYGEKILSYANNIYTIDGGYHETAFKSAFTRAINKVCKDNNLLPKKIDSLNGKDIREGITAVVSFKLPNPQFEGQTKTKLGNSEIRQVIEPELNTFLEKYFLANSDYLKALIDKAISAIEAREASKKARERARKKKKKLNVNLTGKLADCSNRTKNETELYMVEGDSAGGSAKQARERSFQAILPLKGKILNVEGKKLSTILKNNEIMSILNAIGTDIGKDFNINNLRYDKIILMTDADVDGQHIVTLILTLIYNHMKELIERGHVYIAKPPLYKITQRKKEYYLYSDEELSEYRIAHKEDNFKLQRYKGLGEMNPEQLWTTTMDPKARVLEQVTIEDSEYAEEVFDMLMGSDSKKRKKFIFEYSKEIGDKRLQIDV